MEKKMHLQGKVALVTGTGSGIGRATVKALARHGAKVAALNRTNDELQTLIDEVNEECSGQPGEAIPLLADISQPDQVEKAVQEVIRKWGRLDIVVANAGINGVWAPIDQLEPDEWDKTHAINTKGTFLTMRYTVPHLKKQGGAIVIVSSINGTRFFRSAGATAYSASKAAQVAIAKMLAVELGQHHIRVNVICPGSVETKIDDSTNKKNTEAAEVKVEIPDGHIPLTGGRPATADQCAELILFLASDSASHISGTEVWFDGAESLL